MVTECGGFLNRAFLGERLESGQLVAAGLILAAVVILQRETSEPLLDTQWPCRVAHYRPTDRAAPIPSSTSPRPGIQSPCSSTSNAEQLALNT